MTAIALSSIEPNARTSQNRDRGNINIHFTDARSLQSPLASDQWEVGGRRIQFVELGPNQSISVDLGEGRTLAKVITGELTSPVRGVFCEPRGARDTALADELVTSGPEGALLALISERPGAPTQISSMDQLAFKGPMSEALVWHGFHEKFGQWTKVFENVDGYIGPGFHLLDGSGEEIVFVNLWTAGKGADLSTHNHGQPPTPLSPAFAEVHLSICNGTGKGGMYVCAEPGASHRERLAVPSGAEHGPFFAFDADTGRPVIQANGALQYPWHGWQAGTDDLPGQAYDFVAAFEIAPHYARKLTR